MVKIQPPLHRNITTQASLQAMYDKRKELFYLPKSPKRNILLEMVNTLIEKENILGNELERVF